MSVSELEAICAVAIAELFRGAGEILASPMGRVPSLGARLAKATFSPGLVLTDGVAHAVTPEGEIESWMPYREIFNLLWGGRRHVVMGASQIDPFGNQNIAAIGGYQHPRVQLLGFRGAPGNTLNHPTSYWVPEHSPRVFVPAVDVVSGVGYDRAAALGRAGRFHDVRAVVSDLGVFDFGAPERRMRAVSLHPGVSPDQVREATGFPLEIPAAVPTSRLPTAEERAILARLSGGAA